MEWRDIDQVVLQPEHFEALEYAVGQQWVEVSALTNAVRLTAEGSRPHSVTPGGTLYSRATLLRCCGPPGRRQQDQARVVLAAMDQPGLLGVVERLLKGQTSKAHIAAYAFSSAP